MSSHTKIVVLRSKELLYSILLIVILLLIAIVLFSIFVPGADSSDTEATLDTQTAYVPGVYTSTLQLGSSNLEMQVVVDSDHITSISLTNLDESVATMFPLMEPTLTELAKKVIEAQSVENISYSTETKYTSLMLLNSISQALNKAVVSEPEAEVSAVTETEITSKEVTLEKEKMQ